MLGFLRSEARLKGPTAAPDTVSEAETDISDIAHHPPPPDIEGKEQSER